MEQPDQKTHFVKGIIYLILGIVAIVLPHLFTVALEMLIGWLFVIGGVIQLVRAVQPHAEGNYALSIFLGAIYLIGGILLLTSPKAGVLTLTVLLTAFFIVEGITKLLLCWSLRHVSAWPWFLFSGLISLGLATLVIIGWPSTARWFIGLLVGVNLAILGLSEIAVSFAIRRR
jgi:uncharacterized membrane protein HdeD (DUF308 family)